MRRALHTSLLAAAAAALLVSSGETASGAAALTSTAAAALLEDLAAPGAMGGDERPAVPGAIGAVPGRRSRASAPAGAWLDSLARDSARVAATSGRTTGAVVALDRDEARRLVALEGGDTYLRDILAATDSSLTRWPVSGAKPLTYWVQPGASLDEWTTAHRRQVDRAFGAWDASGIPLGFTPAADSASADILVLWTDRFDEPISGRTRWTHDRRGWIRSARITLAVYRHDGTLLSEDAIHALALHEIGHAIGLEHTAAAENVMAPRVRVRNLSPGDVRTARLLYRIPPGRL